MKILSELLAAGLVLGLAIGSIGCVPDGHGGRRGGHRGHGGHRHYSAVIENTDIRQAEQKMKFDYNPRYS